MGFIDWFFRVAGWLKRAIDAAAANGLTDGLVREAYWLVNKAAEQFDEDTDAARQWVLAQLTAKGVPESLARFALEAAVQLLKREKVAA